MIGVLNFEKRKNELYSHDSDYAISYYANDTRTFPAGGYQGIGFKEGNTVEVRVNRSK